MPSSLQWSQVLSFCRDVSGPASKLLIVSHMGKLVIQLSIVLSLLTGFVLSPHKGHLKCLPAIPCVISVLEMYLHIHDSQNTCIHSNVLGSLKSFKHNLHFKCFFIISLSVMSHMMSYENLMLERRGSKRMLLLIVSVWKIHKRQV